MGARVGCTLRARVHAVGGSHVALPLSRFGLWQWAAGAAAAAGAAGSAAAIAIRAAAIRATAIKAGGAAAGAEDAGPALAGAMGLRSA